MSILTKGERDKIREQLDDYTWTWIDIRADDYRDALDTIDALEAERDALRAELQAANLRWTACYEIAHNHHNTRVIGGAHAALREILAVIEGNDSENSADGEGGE